MAFATKENFEARHGALSTDDAVKVTALLDDATALIVNAVADIAPAWATDDDAEVPAAVMPVCVQVAHRAWRNPDGVARQQLGEHSVTYRGDDQSDALYLTSNERRIVRRAGRSNPGAVAGSVGLVSPYSADEHHPMDFYPDGLP